MSFAVKRAYQDEAPLVTVKLDLPPGEPFETFIRRVNGRIGDGRRDAPSRVKTELRFFFLLPIAVLRAAFRVVKALDRWNLLPAGFIEGDPLFASAFMANLGSVGVDHALHHLYDYGTVSLFIVVGKIGPQVFAADHGTVTTRPGLRAGFAFDERINDGHYCFAALELAKQLMQDPAQLTAPWPAV